jgi:hypothetical protein
MPASNPMYSCPFYWPLVSGFEWIWYIYGCALQPVVASPWHMHFTPANWALRITYIYILIPISEKVILFWWVTSRHAGNTEAKNSGYDVFKWPPPTLWYSRLLDWYLKTTWTVFLLHLEYLFHVSRQTHSQFSPQHIFPLLVLQNIFPFPSLSTSSHF